MNDDNKVVEIYDKIAEEYSRIFDKDFSDKEFLDKFSSHLEPKAKILDLGCGTGREAEYLVNKGFSVEGIDLSEKMLEIAKRNYPNLLFRKMDIRELQYDKESFSAIWAGYSLFHIKKDEFIKTVSDIGNILKPKGIFGLVMQEGSGEIEVDEPLLPGEKIYVCLYNFDELKEILQNNDFEVIDRGIKESKLKGELPYNKLLIIAKKK